MDIETIKQNVGRVLKATDIKDIGERKIGKVRDVYTQSDKIILVSTDRHSSFDRIIAHIPFKGQVLNQISAFWFEKTRDILQNHVVSLPDPNVLVAKKCTSILVEMVVRGYLTGVTDTSIWTHYQKGEREFGGVTLPDGMKKNSKLPEPLLTPTTKSEEHDRPITPEEIVSEGLVPQELWNEMAEKAVLIFKRGQEIAAKAGLILVDTKYEFGLDENGKLIFIDEVHTPDSSRYWYAESYDERFTNGLEPEYFDKEFLRVWFKENCDPYKDEVLPEAPADMVAELSRRYIAIYEKITGEKFNVDLSTPIEERIEKNLAAFKI
ncbi:MAG: phosphoribosylaminoimidazolesuccinocarboxamide synthase [Candidatus Paceibacterota bacterium]|jgi:phosphoribosylaminoimidazole-succinocarboxamide synthase